MPSIAIEFLLVCKSLVIKVDFRPANKLCERKIAEAFIVPFFAIKARARKPRSFSRCDVLAIVPSSALRPKTWVVYKILDHASLGLAKYKSSETMKKS